jgi:putative transcriptional regulator
MTTTMTDNCEFTGAEIKRLRLSLGMTQIRFAEILGVSFATVNRWENGHAKPSPLAIYKIRELCDTR